MGRTVTIRISEGPESFVQSLVSLLPPAVIILPFAVACGLLTWLVATRLGRRRPSWKLWQRIAIAACLGALPTLWHPAGFWLRVLRGSWAEGDWLIWEIIRRQSELLSGLILAAVCLPVAFSFSRGRTRPDLRDMFE